MISQETKRRLETNWQQVQQAIAQAAEANGRSADDVTIVGVSKYVDSEMTAALLDIGCEHLGESRPQTLWEKADALGTRCGLHWHLIGHLQRNKIRRTLPFNPLIHSVDSGRLLQSIADEAVVQDRTVKVLLEVNISGDQGKTGLSPQQLNQIMQQLPIKGIHVRGLMAMAGWGTEPDQARQQFDQVRLLRDQIQQQLKVPLPELSMGMSGDFSEAIAAGATMVRIGSSLFAGIR